MKQYFVYMITNWNNRVMYIGVTNNLERRLFEHRNDLVDGFSKKYKLYKLVHLEETTDIQAAIAREKQIKGWSHQKKNELVRSVNPEWADLFPQVQDPSLRSG